VRNNSKETFSSNRVLQNQQATGHGLLHATHQPSKPYIFFCKFLFELSAGFWLTYPPSSYTTARRLSNAMLFTSVHLRFHEWFESAEGVLIPAAIHMHAGSPLQPAVSFSACGVKHKQRWH